MMDWINKIIISFFLMIDRVVYWAIEKVYELFILISEAGIFSQSTIQTFANRVYVFLGLIMIFVVSVSLVKYILNPKSFSDSKVGGAKLLKDFAFVLIGIIMIPYVFEIAYGLQRIVLKDNLIGNLILGIKYYDDSNGSENASDFATYGGKMMAYSTLSAFITFNPEIASYTCINEPVTSSGEFNEPACGQIGDVPYSGGLDEKGDEILNVKAYTEFVNRNKDFRALANKEYVTLIYESTAGDYNLIDYSFIMSTIAGGFIVFMLLGFCIDIAVRSVKLGFLQLIAPVPLMMKIIPGSGQKKFDDWVKECVKTFTDIFVKLAAIYFAIFIIASITTDGIQNVAGTENFVQTTLVKVAIIIGSLMFAKELPDLIKKIIGGSGDGKGFTFGKAALAGGAALGMAAASNTWATGRKIGSDLKSGKSLGESLLGHKGGFFADKDGNTDGSSLINASRNMGRLWANTGGFLAGGAISGGARGVVAGYNGGKGNSVMKAASDATKKNNKAREFKKIMAANDYGMKDRIIDGMDISSGVQNQYASSGKWAETYQDLANKIDDTGTQENNAYHQLANLKSSYITNGGDSYMFEGMNSLNNNGEYNYTSFDDFKSNYVANDEIIRKYEDEMSDIRENKDGKYKNETEIEDAIMSLQMESMYRANDISSQLESDSTKKAFENSRSFSNDRKRYNEQKQKYIKQQKSIGKIQSGGPNGK